MPEYDNNNRGAIWKNTRKTTDKHPDFKGTAVVDNVSYRVSAWKRETGVSGDKPALRFSFTPRDSDESRKAIQSEFDDDIPF